MQTYFDKKILIYEISPILEVDIKNRLQHLGFNKLTIYQSLNDVELHLENEKPHITIVVLHNLYEDKILLQSLEFLDAKRLPYIVCTSKSKEEHLARIFPYNPLDLIDLTEINNFTLTKSILLGLQKAIKWNNALERNRYFFLKVGKVLKKIDWKEIEMVTVDGKYLDIHVENKVHVIRSSLNDFLLKLPNNFVKVHQSYIVNLDYVESISVDESKIKLKNCQAFFSRAFKKVLVNEYLLS